MDNDEAKQLLSVLSVMQQDMHEIKFKFLQILADNKIQLNQQIKDVQVQLMILEAILKKHFGNDFIDESDIFKKI